MKRYEPTIGHDKEGWPEPVMTDHPGGDFVKYDEAAAIERQRDRLYMALISVKNSIVCAPVEVIADTLWMSETETTVDYIDAMLAEIEKGNK